MFANRLRESRGYWNLKPSNPPGRIKKVVLDSKLKHTEQHLAYYIRLTIHNYQRPTLVLRRGK
jgi:hypothetical protein